MILTNSDLWYFGKDHYQIKEKEHDRDIIIMTTIS